MDALRVRLVDGIPNQQVGVRVFTDRATIDAAANLVNQLLPAVSGPRTGTRDTGLRVEFSFSDSRRDHKHTTVIGQPSHGLAVLTDSGAEELALDDREGRLLAEARRLLSI